MDTLTRISRVNVLFDEHPSSDDLSIVIRFPVKFMTQEEMDALNDLLLYGKFYIGLIDFSLKAAEGAMSDPRVITVKDLSTALHILLGDGIPYFDPHLN